MLTRTRAPEEAPSEAKTGLGSVCLRDVAKTFAAPRRGVAPVTAVRDLSLAAAPGEIVAVVGPSGCGKTTLLELVCGLIEPDSGVVDAAPAALMAQRDLLLPWRSAVDNAALALDVAGVERAAAREQAPTLLHDFGLAGFERARPAELSGGMRQRVAFMRTLLAGRPVLLLDEPFASLDSITRAGMQQWLADGLEREPRTVLLVTHDVEEALFLADRVVVLSPRPGRVVCELDVPLARPRDRRAAVSDPVLADLRLRALEALGA
jgi:ABC-type nitrate/sulfonate/bicarbonate transport system ATPase subunit